MRPIAKYAYLDYARSLRQGELHDEHSDSYRTFLNKMRHVLPYEEQLAHMMQEYPSIFPKRRNAVCHLYCVIGNGYDWANGGLVTSFPGRTVAERKADKIRDKEFKELKNSIKALKGITGDLGEALNNILDDKPVMGKFTTYPLHVEYSKACTVPDDVREDYFRGALEALGLVLEHGTSEDMKVAAETWKQLARRFPHWMTK